MAASGFIIKTGKGDTPQEPHPAFRQREESAAEIDGHAGQWWPLSP